MKYVADDHGSNPTTNQQFDQVQVMLQRKQERLKYMLTEEDANLLLSHSVEKTFTDGQVIIEKGLSVNTVYRVKSGKVVGQYGNASIELTKGFFIGEHLFLTNKPYISLHGFVASGTVVLYELNAAFVKQLLDINITLSVKFYKYLASKFTTIYYRLLEQLFCPEDAEIKSAVATRSVHKRSSHKSQQAYKDYPIWSIGNCRNGVQTIGLTAKGIEMVAKSFGFKSRIKVNFNKFQTAVANGATSLTIHYEPKKSTTVEFKKFVDREEFIKLITSITSVDVVRTPRSSMLKDTEEIESPSDDMDKRVFESLQITKEFKKGDKILEQGDLYQRVFVLASGSFEVYTDNKLIKTLQQGEVLGVASLIYVRPVPVTLVVASETATVHIIPVHKVQELVKVDPRNARQFYLAAAKHLQDLVLSLFEPQMAIDGATKK